MIKERAMEKLINEMLDKTYGAWDPDRDWETFHLLVLP